MAAVEEVSGGRVRTARFACGGVAHKPWRVEAAEAVLDRGSAGAVSPNARHGAEFSAAADALLAGARGHGHNDFKIPLLRRTLGAALAEAVNV